MADSSKSPDGGRPDTQTNGLDSPRASTPADDAPRPIKDEDANDADVEALDWAAQVAKDDEDIGRFFETDPTKSNMPKDLHSFADKEIDQNDKADDAIDFEDISDDDLASDGASINTADPGISQIPGLTEDEGTSHETQTLDDLFGEGEVDNDQLGSSPPPPPPRENADRDTETAHESAADHAPGKEQEIPPDEEWNKLSIEQMRKYNFSENNAVANWVDQTNNDDPNLQNTPLTKEELIAQKFPDFSKNKTLYFNQLFPQWPAEYLYKEPPTKDKEPPEFVPTKLELELDADNSKLFRIRDNTLNGTHARNQQMFDGDSWEHTLGAPALEYQDAFSDDSEDEDYRVGGLTLHEIATICDDWVAPLRLPEVQTDKETVMDTDFPDGDEDWMREYMQSKAQTKKRRYQPGLPDISSYESRGLDDFFSTTRRSAQHVRLDPNDPYLVLDDLQAERPAKRPKLEDKTKRMASGQLGRDIMHYFNISNDAEYETLKKNHKHKVRSILNSKAAEHSMPALKLTYPFYRTKVAGQYWDHHRKKLDVDKIVRHSISVRKPARIKKKDWKNKTVAETFKTSKDLSLNDNSTSVLFEYCEQFPMLLSNFGMGNRIINYYRRDGTDEEKAPKLDLGESQFLNPEDRSPFSIFGSVDPGETVPTLHNEMYRAPIFKHQPRETDFLLGYATNATEGPRWYLKNIDHVYVVGQTFPSMEVPGPHARKVTNTTKNRLKMISYRMMRHKPTEDITLNEVTPHVFERHDPQNRQKMKEFLSYDRERKVWVLPEGQTLLDEAGIRAMIKPEDVCLIESMQVGYELLENTGYDSRNKEEQDEDGDEHIQRMAPWTITRNFLEASANKAMVALHGEGDPTGHGLGFSFIKTSMKGGYINAVQGPLATSADAMERERKANGGHAYNVKEQNRMYQSAIRDIWERQKTTLSDGTAHEDTDVLDTSNEDDRFNEQRQVAATPAAPIDDGRSQLSRLSAASRLGRRKLKITRKKRNGAGELETVTEIVEDPVVVRNYMKHRREREELERDVYSFQATADADANRDKAKLVDRELARLLKNQDRRQVREKQGKSKKKSANNNDDTPDPSSGDKASGTTRKCANCGQVGHIKTNKSKCPLLNGTITTNNESTDHGGFGSFSKPAAGANGND